jgi:FixJ family two-component response regulator
MPGGSGPEVARALQAMNPTAPVVYMSGYTNDAIGSHGVLSPDVLLVAKPFSSEQLREAVGEALRGTPEHATG